MANSERRWLTEAERTLARSVFGDAIHYSRVQIRHRKWFVLQRPSIVMAPDGHIWFHGLSHLYRHCFGQAEHSLQALFIHEMVHVWQHQQGLCLPLARHPFCRYEYDLISGKSFTDYGIEQQAEIVRHLFLLRQGIRVKGVKAPLIVYEELIPFDGPSIAVAE